MMVRLRDEERSTYEQYFVGLFGKGAGRKMMTMVDGIMFIEGGDVPHYATVQKRKVMKREVVGTVMFILLFLVHKKIFGGKSYWHSSNIRVGVV
jgi:hypothetical protein